MSVVAEILRDRRKSELQAMYQFWFPGEGMLSKREELEARILGALVEGIQLQDGVSRLTRVQKAMLKLVLTESDHRMACQSLHTRVESQGSPSVEVENAARMLSERGFISRVRETNPSREVYAVPEELAEHLTGVFELDRPEVQPADQVSQKRLPFEISFDRHDLEKRIAKLKDPVLRRVLRIALDNQGLAELGTPGVMEALSSARRSSASANSAGSDDATFPKTWRQDLEESGVGTVGSVSLKDYGILVDEPAVIIFQEWIKEHTLGLLSGSVETDSDLSLFPNKGEIVPDAILEAGCDLCIDIDGIATHLGGEPLVLAQGSKLPKRLYDSIRGVMVLTRIDDHLDGDVVEWVINLTRRLGILEIYADQLTVHEERLHVWRKLDLSRKVDMILTKFLEENRGPRWSFHQESLRKIFVDLLQELQPQDWLPLDALVSQATSTYLLELEEREVREALRQRREEDFSRERLTSTFHGLGRDLTHWVVNRFMPLGLCELALMDGRLAGFRLTALGKECLGVDREPRDSRILVNPNCEIMLFSEGLRGMQLEVTLARFAERVSAEGARRYRITRDSMQGGLRSGLVLKEIRATLEKASDHPLPEPVIVALNDWGKNLEWVQVEPCVALTGLGSERAQELSDTLEEEDVAHVLCPDGTILVREEQVRSGLLREALEVLREDGWLIRDRMPRVE